MQGQEPVVSFAEKFPSVLSNLEAFAKAVWGEQPYPVSRAEMLANVAALEAIMKSVTSRQVESVATPSIAL